MQKAQVVALMKSTAGLPLTLAIGDGGNDVSMIQEAHVGIGIYGHEGMQAVRAADFAIATFHHLSRLLLVHGRWNHRRVSNVILFSFYKNMALIVTLLMYSLENGYSGQTLYESYLMVGWNVLYTILPIFVLGISDEDICDNAVLHYPFVYRSALRKSELSIQKLSIWVANAWLHSAIVYFVTTRTLKYIVSPQGFANGLFVDGTAVYGALIITVSLKAALIMQRFHRWTKLHYISLVGGFAIFLVFVLVYSQAYSLMPQFNFLRDFYGIATMLFEEKMYWVMLAFISITSIIPDLAAAYFKEMYIPASDDIIREIDSGLGTSSSSSDKTQETVNAFRRASRLTERNDSSNRIVSIAAVAAAAVAGVNIKQRQDVSSSLIDGEWSQKFRDFDRPTEHDELSKQLVALQTEIAHELGTADPVSREEEAHSSRALAVNPAVHPLTLEFMGEEHRQLENEYAFTSACRERARFLLCLKVVAILIPVYALIEYYIEKDNNKWTIRIGFLVSDLILLRFVKTKIFLKNYTSSILATFCLAGIALTITIAQNGKFGAALYPIGLFVVVRVNSYCLKPLLPLVIVKRL
jgi:phospholipid-transporting ATPase